ncbi:MAG: hypothetical protein QM493_11675 [Sulfurovum sp.]
MLKFIYIIIFSLLFLTNSLSAIEESKIPPSLMEWKDWVLDDIKDRDCPISYQNGSTQCSWFKDISVALNGDKLEFNLSVTLYKDKTKVSLPSANQAWVEDVTVDGKNAIVINSRANAIVILDRGTHTITGFIPWRNNLKYLQLPSSIALVTLYKYGKKVPNISVDKNARLWLDKKGSAKNEKGTLSVSIYRKVIDAHPLKMQTYLHFSVSGKMRSVILDGIVLDEFLPTAINSQLDTTITEDKKLKVEIKAGEWRVWIDSYTPLNLTKLTKPKYKFTYANEEVWTLQTSPNYRSIEIEGAKSIDPTQTMLPEQWKRLPAYLMSKGEFGIKELYKSISQQQKNEFKLVRKLWLDFDGSGYTIEDKINATISEVRRLEAKDILDLGSVSVNNKPTLITQLNKNSQKGVELREPNFNIVASSRYEGDISLIPASGWDEKFDSVSTTLHLPVGWKLFASFGADGKGSGWVDHWKLMDIFLVLLLSIAIYQLYGFKWSLLMTPFIILLWHESEAPTLIWFALLILVALLRVLGDGKMRKFLKVIMWGVVALAIFKVLSFSVTEIRTALYPQLEYEYKYKDNSMRLIPMREKTKSMNYASSNEDEVGMNIGLTSIYDKDTINLSSYAPTHKPKMIFKKEAEKSQNQMMQNRIDPDAVVQTGVAKPTWNANSHRFFWQSTVSSDEKLELWLITPTISKLLKILHIIGMLFLLYMFLREFVGSVIPKLNRNVIDKNGVKVLSLLLILTLTPHTLRADMPSQTMLNQLKTKLTQPPTCLPDCASIQRVDVSIVDDILEINIDMSAGANISLPIFGNRNVWLPSSVTIDEKEATLNIDRSGRLWVMLESGVHKLTLKGSIKGNEQIVLSSLLPIHNLQTKFIDKSWQLSTDNRSYIEINNLSEQKAKEREKSKIEPLVEIKRTLYFGQRWYIDTEVRLLNTINKPHTLSYRLLPNESILDKDIEQKKSSVIIHLDSRNSYHKWRSSLPITQTLELELSKDSRYIEIWQMDISAIWDVSYAGIEPIEQLRIGSTLIPRFRPWRGEKLKLTMHKAKAVSGENLTIESSRLNITQSTRYRDVKLELNIKSSKAGQYSINIDGITKLKPTIINGKTHYLKINNGKVSIPLQAKAQKIKLSWREEIGADNSYIFPTIDLNKPSVNSNISLTMPHNRWILWTNGPTIGPAVLLWGVLLAVLLFALIIGRVKGTPLKTTDWLLLGVGLSTTSVFIMIPIVIWIFAIKIKAEKGLDAIGKVRFLSFIGFGLVLLTLIALGSIITAISIGLLGNPDMMIMGNGSYGSYLNWYSDRISSQIAEPTLFSVSIWFYRALILIWAIWIAFSLIKWLKWAWEKGFADKS